MFLLMSLNCPFVRHCDVCFPHTEPWFFSEEIGAENDHDWSSRFTSILLACGDQRDVRTSEFLARLQGPVS